MEPYSVLSARNSCIGVFAHNEEKRIIRALDCIELCLKGLQVPITVLENGSSDNTLAVAKAYAMDRRHVQVMSLDIGDKSNAWNHFVHALDPVPEVVFFTDGDCWVQPDSLQQLYRTLCEQPQANAVSAIPCTGRHRQQQISYIVKEHQLVGNLYALRGTFVERIRQQNIFLPVGLIGDDALVSALAKWNLSPFKHGWKDELVVANINAQFGFDSLSPWKRKNWRTYWNRRVHYSRRKFENIMLRRLIGIKGGLHGIPRHIQETYHLFEQTCKPKYRGLEGLFEWVAARKIKKYVTAQVPPGSRIIEKKKGSGGLPPGF
ncbi:MAG: glycosyltransferase [Magnetococcales bacterium]|nr:glycosyltransferase [Magnetococcales bacterium]